MPEEPTQRTPSGRERDELDLPGTGDYEIPVPDRESVFGALRRAARKVTSRE